MLRLQYPKRNARGGLLDAFRITVQGQRKSSILYLHIAPYGRTFDTSPLSSGTRSLSG